MDTKEKLYETMLSNMVEKLDGYMKCLKTIQNNYHIQEEHKEILLNGQLQMVFQLIESDKQQIDNILNK